MRCCLLQWGFFGTSLKPLVFIWTKNKLEWVIKWASYSQFWFERLSYSSGDFLGQGCNVWLLSEPKMTRMCQESSYIWLFSFKRLHDKSWDHLGHYCNLWCSFEPKMTRMGKQMGKLFFLERLHESSGDSSGQGCNLWLSFGPKITRICQ